MEVHTNPEVDSAFALENIDFSLSPVVRTNFTHFLREGEFRPSQRRLLDDFTLFRLKVDFDCACTRDKLFIWRWRRVGSLPILRAFFGLRPSGRRVPALRVRVFWAFDGQQLLVIEGSPCQFISATCGHTHLVFSARDEPGHGHGVRLVLPGCLGRAWCWRVRLSGPPTYPDDHGSLGEAGTGPSSCVSLWMLLEAFPVLCARAVRPWNLVHYFHVRVSGSHCFGHLGVAYVYESWILREMTFLRGCNAWFNSGYMLCVSTLEAMNDFYTFSTLRRTRILKLSFSIWFEWRSMPSRCFWLQSCSARFARGKLEVLFTSFT